MDWSRHPGVQLAARQIQSGGVVAYPTESVWGLGCDPFNPEAVAKLLFIKQRPVEKGLILVAANLEQVQPWLDGLDAQSLSRLYQTWPGPMTWLLPNNGLAPSWVTGGSKFVAVRVSEHPLVSALCGAVGGPVISTSANPSGRAPARNRLTVQRYFGGVVDAIAPGLAASEVQTHIKPTEIRDLLTDQVIRQG